MSAGAPECDIARRDRSKSVSQTIDTWSFGCVLSVSATWVVLGYQGVRAYHEQRRSAIKKLRERQQSGEDVTVPVADDAFHDGTDVLPEVREWHDALRGVLRVSDTITGRILKIIDEYMLVTESVRQLKTISVHNALQRELSLAGEDYQKLVSMGIVQPVTESVKQALLNVENPESSPANSQAMEVAATNTPGSLSLSNHSSLAHPPRHQLKSSRINKLMRMDQLPVGRVAHRQDALRTQGQPGFMIESEPVGAGFTRENTLRPRPIPHSTPHPTPNPIPSVNAFKTIAKMPNEKEPAPRGSSTFSNIYRGSANSGYGTPFVRPEDTVRPEYPLTRRERSMPLRTDSERAAVAPIPLSIEIPKSHTLPNTPFYIHPSWQIAQEHELEMGKEKGVRALFGFKKQDEYLKQFLVERDIVSKYGTLSRS